MSRSKKKPGKIKSLSHGRPPYSKVTRCISSKATKKIICNYHTLQREYAKALTIGDDDKAMALTKKIESQGGIKVYQQASLLGQSKERGGDSSKLLLEWLKPLTFNSLGPSKNDRPLRMLEIGALSSTNACSTCNLFEVERIDLNSHVEGVKQQDFMERPFPQSEMDKFDIISLSLVLNFVPDAIGRGKMLERTLEFLRPPQFMELKEFYPCIFLVLPAPCVLNSRYLDEARLKDIMQSLGYNCLKQKFSEKLAYSLWHLKSPNPISLPYFSNRQLRTGCKRNNFAIILPPKNI